MKVGGKAESSAEGHLARRHHVFQRVFAPPTAPRPQGGRPNPPPFPSTQPLAHRTLSGQPKTGGRPAMNSLYTLGVRQTNSIQADLERLRNGDSSASLLGPSYLLTRTRVGEHESHRIAR
jgi:hypothetical protein